MSRPSDVLDLSGESYRYLTAEHKLKILTQRALELEADLYRQREEVELTLSLSIDPSKAEARTEALAKALAHLYERISALE